MDTSALRSPAGAAWRLRPGAGDRAAGQLVFLDHTRHPSDHDVAAALTEARRRGYRTVRTSALFPAAAAVVERAGFAVADRLALLRLGVLDPATWPPANGATHALRPWHRRAAAAVDRAAFGAGWGNDVAGLLEIERATPRHRSRWVPRPDARAAVAGVALTGAAASTGYLQRLAVAPDLQGRGLGTALVADALAWMHALQLTEALVNTGVDNQPALGLYARFGFVQLPDVLTIAEYTIPEPDRRPGPEHR